MVYKQINSKIVIGTVFERFNIDYSGFVSRVPNWIHSAMRQMEIHTSLISKTVDGEVVDYKCAIPSDCKILMGVSYLSKRLERTDKINQKVTDDMDSLVSSRNTYELDNNGYIITTFETCDSGQLKFYIKTLPLELDTTTNLYFPLIPDNQDLLTALEWYVLQRLLERGHKVRDFRLNVVTAEFERWARIARNSVGKMDMDERNEISNMMRTFLYDRNYHTSGSFNNTYTN